jgi:2'-5' RNA ligase
MTYPLTLKAKAHTGAMVALFLAPELAAELAIPGGESPEDLHITLAYLGEADEIQNKEYLQNIVMQLGQSLGPMYGRLNGLARFNTGKEGDKTPYVILPDLPDLPEARQLITSTIRENGYYVARNHGYIPHITIAYQDDGEPWPADNVGEREIGFTTINL